MRTLLAAFTLGSGAVALAEDLQVTVHQVEVSHQQMTTLLADGLPDRELFTKVRGMVTAKSAKLRDSSLIRLKTGQRATVESIREVIYPTEYDPDNAKWDGKERKPLSEEELKKQQEQWRREAFAATFFPVVGGALYGFETRYVGLTFQVDSEEDGQGLAWSVESVSQARESIMGQTLGLDGKPRVQRLPNFDSLSLTGDSPVSKGVTFAGVLTPVAEDGSLARDRKILVFVKADLLK